LDKLEIPSFLKTYFGEDGSRTTFNGLSFVKDLQFVAPIHKCRRRRCYLGIYDDWDLGDTVDLSLVNERERANYRIHEDFIENISDTFRSSFFHLPKNSLRAFAYVVKRPDSLAQLIIVAGN
jgi:hypothetical protein